MNAYDVYGLCVHSELPLPRLPACHRDPDVVVRVGEVDVRPEAGELRCRHDRVVTLSLRDGWLVTAQPHPGAHEWLVGNAVVDLLTVVLERRGRLVLHASAVAIDGAAVAFAGTSGRGKSTLAAALRFRGHDLVADDATVVELLEGRCVVRAGPCQVSLWPDAAAHLTRAETPASHAAAKLVHGLVPAPGRHPIDLRRVYVLADGHRHAIEPYAPKDAMMALMPHLYRVPCAGGDAIGDLRRRRTQSLERFGRLAGSVGVCRLRVVRSLASLSALAELVEEDVADALRGSARAPVWDGAGAGDRSGAGLARDRERP